MTNRRPRVVAIVQARMGSTRLPGKVLRPIAGKPLLWHVLHRLEKCRTLNAVVVATSRKPDDDAVEAFCREQGIPCIRGSETNVLERYVQAAAATNADIVVRVTGDAVFVDPDFIDYLVTRLIDDDGDYVLIGKDQLCVHEGVDPFTRRALEKLEEGAGDDPIAREHVTGYFKIHPGFARLTEAAAYPPLAVAFEKAPHLSIDAPTDIALADAVYRELGAPVGDVSLPEILQLLRRDPDLRAINAGVVQKPIGHVGGVAILACEGGGALGYGHIRRSLSLARSLRDREGLGVVFAFNGNDTAAATIRDAGFEVTLLPGGDQMTALGDLIKSRSPRLMIVDSRTNIAREDIVRFATMVRPLAIIDDISDRRLAATHAYYPPMPQVSALSWEGSACDVRVGWEWSVLGMDVSPLKPAEDERGAPPRLLVTMGGSDPLNLSRLALDALANITTPFHARFVIGPDFQDADSLRRAVHARGHDVVPPGADLRVEFAAFDLALIAFGVTAYEMATLGIPAVYLAIAEDHAVSASAFVSAGMGKLASRDAGSISTAIELLLADPALRETMSRTARTLIDGNGAQRIAAELAAVAR